MVGAVLFIVLAPIMFIAGIVALIVFGIQESNNGM